jgi:rhodanese-related sulfurtransferase
MSAAPVTPAITPQAIRAALIARDEIAIVDLRDEAAFATGHPLFASQLPPDRLEIEAPNRFPRRDATIVLYDNGEGLTGQAADRFHSLGYGDVRVLEGGLRGWADAGYELFEDVNSYSKAFGELVEHRRGTPSLAAPEVQALIDGKADIAILDARRFDEFNTMALPGGISVPGAELVLRAATIAPDPETTIIVNCAGRTRSIIGTQSLINAGLPNRIVALAGQTLAHGREARFPDVADEGAEAARHRARNVAYRAGVKQIDAFELAALTADARRTLYSFDVRTPEEYADGHPLGFRSAPGGQLVQETDHFAPVRGARIVLSDGGTQGLGGPRADMTASWLAQLGWEVYVLAVPIEGRETGNLHAVPPRGAEGRYRRPYEGTDNPAAAMQAYLDWEYGLVDQLARDGTHGFFVI